MLEDREVAPSYLSVKDRAKGFQDLPRRGSRVQIPFPAHKGRKLQGNSEFRPFLYLLSVKW